jgi:beta-galactosidase
VELFLNGASQGVRVMTRYGHAEWPATPTTPGSLCVQAYMNASGSAPVASQCVNTTGPAAALRISVQDGAYLGGADGTMVAGCNDVAMVMVEVVDAAGAVVPTASHNVSFALTSAPAGVLLQGTANGDPAATVNSKNSWRSAFHGLCQAVVTGGDAPGAVTVQASTPGLPPASITLPIVAPSAGFAAKPPTWCKALGPRL